MLVSDGPAAGPNGIANGLGAIRPGDQALVELRGGDFDYGALPDEAFENLLVLSVGRSVQDIEDELRTQGCDLNKVGVIPIGVGSAEYTGPMWHTDTIYPSDLTGISIAFSQASTFLRENEGWIVFDALNILFMYAESQRLYPLIDDIAQQVRRKGLHGVFTVDVTSVEDAELNRFRQTVDDVLSLP